jgi:hypothetical protein
MSEHAVVLLSPIPRRTLRCTSRRCLLHQVQLAAQRDKDACEQWVIKCTDWTVTLLSTPAGVALATPTTFLGTRESAQVKWAIYQAS